MLRNGCQTGDLHSSIGVEILFGQVDRELATGGAGTMTVSTDATALVAVGVSTVFAHLAAVRISGNDEMYEGDYVIRRSCNVKGILFVSVELCEIDYILA